MSALPSDWVKAAARELGFDLVGVCDASPPQGLAFFREWLGRGYHASMGYLERSAELRADLACLLPGARSVVAVGLNYHQEQAVQAGAPRIASYALGRDYHKVVRGKLRRLAARLAEEHPGAQFRACVDSAPVFEREYAQRAGLGWFGRNTCLINKRLGSWFVIGLLMTDLDITADAPSMEHCPDCRRCVDACPTGAIVFEGGRWQVDARRCVSYLTVEHRGEVEPELAEGVGNWTFGCDACQSACPFNAPKRLPQTHEPDFRKLREWPGLSELAELDEERWDALTRGSTVRRAGVEQLRRNARINLANGGR